MTKDELKIELEVAQRRIETLILQIGAADKRQAETSALLVMRTAQLATLAKTIKELTS